MRGQLGLFAVEPVKAEHGIGISYIQSKQHRTLTPAFLADRFFMMNLRPMAAGGLKTGS
jgi:hypothetical protein